MPQFDIDEDELQELPLLISSSQESREAFLGHEQYHEGLDNHITLLSRTLSKINHRECRKWLPATAAVLLSSTSSLLLLKWLQEFLKLPTLTPAKYFLDQYSQAFDGYCGQRYPLVNLSYANSLYSNDAEKECALAGGAEAACRLSKPFYQFITEFIPDTNLTCLEKFNISVNVNGFNPEYQINQFLSSLNDSLVLNIEFCYDVATDLCNNGIACVVNGINTLCQTTSYLPKLYSYSDWKICEIYHYDVQIWENFKGCQNYLPLNISNICDTSSYFNNSLVWCYQRALTLTQNSWDTFGFHRYYYENSYGFNNSTMVRCGEAFPDYCHLNNISNCYYAAQTQLKHQLNDPWWDVNRMLLLGIMLLAFLLAIASAAYLLWRSIQSRPQHKFFKLPAEERRLIEELKIKIDPSETVATVSDRLLGERDKIHANIDQQNAEIKKKYIQDRIQRPDEIASKQEAVIGFLSLWQPSPQKKSLPPEIGCIVGNYLTRQEANNIFKSCRLANSMGMEARKNYLKNNPGLEPSPLLENLFTPSARLLKLV